LKTVILAILINIGPLLSLIRENDQDGDIDSVDGHSISRVKLRGSRIIATRDYEPVI
jgi:hypothetical protein